MRFREPIKGLELEFAILSADRIVIPSIQRELSDMHIKRLMESMEKIGFVEPLTVVPTEDEYYEVINGQHRFEAGRRLGMSEFPVIILPASAKDYIIALNVEKVNEQGGIKVGDRHYKVDIVYYDDQSDPTTTARLVERLIVQDGIRFILGPYGSAQVFAAAPIVEKYGALMVQAGGASSDIYEKGYKNIFGLYTIAPNYGRDLVELATTLDRNLKTIAIVYEKDIFAQDAAQGAYEHAQKKGLKVVLFEGYPKEAQDLSSLIQKVRLQRPDIIIGSGHFADSVLLVKQLKQFRVNPKFLGLTVGPALPAFVKSLGEDAEGIFGPVQWSPALNYKDPVFGNTQNFVKLYRERFKEDPEYHVAGAVAAGIVFQKSHREGKKP